MNAPGIRARALWYVAPGRAELREEWLPPRAPDQALVRTRATALSRGTERLVLEGRVPASQHDTMRAPLMGGEFPFPVKYGYCAMGVVEEGPEALTGRRVFVLHPHQDRFLAPAAMCVPVPEAVPDHRAVLAANMETALNIVWDARPLPGERCLVIGAGVVGLLVAALLARMPGIAPTVVDLDPSRAALAESLGARFARPGDAPAEQELVVHASASAAGLRLALDRAGFEARIVEASWHGDRAVPLPLGEAFHSRRLSIIGSQVGSVAPAMRGRRTHAERLALALELLEDPRLDALCAPVARFEALPAALPALLAAGSGAPPCPVVTYI
ncbi:zinc-dependent alcohol dehydrogenase [Paracraurococcus lichenis]|uniref:Zinc-binding alcohol dehydrogenase n=1 Tax=Paracraurococcus lichenis TaxID=3064888 RepID=A0ABT9DT69_9PROT|nr:zinc-binding alcohol dehydrogenase [Paracraurococcus sp. LOR1-02]MDO9707096.1 zinc-binding alcohol dehydrogenase [Paracraurococcus sp. LOR1-02]